MKVDPNENGIRFADLSMSLALMGFLLVMLTFPSGIYNGFVFACTSAAAAIISKRSFRAKRSTAALVIDVLTLISCCIRYAGLVAIYANLDDPVMGPQITRYVLDVCSAFGISPEDFTSLMR